MRGLNGKRILIAGGATGIGAATAERLGGEGAHVAVADISFERAELTAAGITDRGGRATAYEFDLADTASVEAMVSAAAKELGGIDGLFNVGAAVGLVGKEKDKSVLEVDDDLWRQTFEVNLFGYARTTRAVIPHLLEAGAGSIVNISSGASVLAFADMPAYASSKAAVNSLTRHTAAKFGKSHIRCNAVMPGNVLGESQRRNNNTDIHQASLARMLGTRLGDPTDLAAIATFLLSDDAEWITGQVWSVDGGMHLGN